MFLADATFEVAEKPDPTDPRIEGMQFRMALVSLANVREVESVPYGQYGTYAQVVRTLTNILPDWAAFAGQMPHMKRQYHVLRFDSREEIDALCTSMNASGPVRAS